MHAPGAPATHVVPPARGRALRGLPLASALLAFAVYATTAARTITWWDGSSYPLAAVTLGIPGAPGSLLLTLLGWVVSRIPLVFPVAFRLHLFAALIGAALVALVGSLGARLATPEGREPGAAEHGAGALAGLAFAFAFTPWTYATQFTPYGLSALWTALLLVAALAWWRRPEGSSGHARLFVLFLLFGLDVSVHRTNLLLLPAALLWVAIRVPRSPRPLGDVAAAAAGLVLGLAFHLLLIPMAARGPGYMVEDTSTWAGWWSYVSVAQKGGGFLVNLFPRTASFLGVQVADYLAFLARNLGAALWLPAGLAALGWALILRDHPRRALGLLAFFLCAGPGAVVYFNLPQHYFRAIDRHYLPSLVILAPWIAVGAAALLRGAARLPARAALVTVAALALALPAALAWRANHEACDLSRVRFAEGFARDLLEPLPPGAILLTNGDNDSMPLWYLQQAEGVRRDVTVVNLPLCNTGGFVTRLRRADPAFAGLFAGERLPAVLQPTGAPGPVAVAVGPNADLGLPDGVTPPDSVVFRPQGLWFGEDRAALELLQLTHWRRPLHLACTVSREHLTWLWPFARLDGLAFRVIPTDDPAVHDVGHLRRQLFERVRYAGLADTTLALDRDSRSMCSNYVSALLQLASEQMARNQAEDALATLRFMDEHAPPSRMGLTSAELAAFRAHVEDETRRRRRAHRARRRALRSRSIRARAAAGGSLPHRDQRAPNVTPARTEVWFRSLSVCRASRK